MYRNFGLTAALIISSNTSCSITTPSEPVVFPAENFEKTEKPPNLTPTNDDGTLSLLNGFFDLPVVMSAIEQCRKDYSTLRGINLDPTTTKTRCNKGDSNRTLEEAVNTCKNLPSSSTLNLPGMEKLREETAKMANKVLILKAEIEAKCSSEANVSTLSLNQ